MKSYEKLVVGFGSPANHVFRLKPGESVIFENGEAKRGETISVKEVFVHGLGIGDIGKVVLEDRTLLGDEGVVVAVLKLQGGKIIGKPELTSRGFVFQQKFGGVLDEASYQLTNSLQKKNMTKVQEIKNFTNQFLEKYFFDKTRRKPMILPVVVEV
jgi:ribonuclease J